MSVGRVLTLGLGVFGGAKYLPTLGYSSGTEVAEVFGGGYALWNPAYLVARKRLEQEIPPEVEEIIEEVTSLGLNEQSSEIALRIKTREIEWDDVYLEIQKDLQDAIRQELATELHELREIRLHEMEMARLAFNRENNRRIAIIMLLN